MSEATSSGTKRDVPVVPNVQVTYVPLDPTRATYTIRPAFRADKR